MKFEATQIDGCFILDLEKRADDRGFFARVYCDDEYRKHGLDPVIHQANMAYSARKGTLRGMHFQSEPAADTKTIRCTAGRIYDVCVDLRPASPSFKQWVGVELSAENRRQLFLPAGCAHAYQTLEDDCEIMYTTNQPYAPDCATGVRYNDPAFGISWPLPIAEISDADANWPDFAG